MKKIVKLLPVALLMLACPAFAALDGTHQQSTDLQLTIPSYLDIKQTGDAAQAATMSAIDDQYKNFSIQNAFVAQYKVYNNQPGRTLYLTAKPAALDVNAIYEVDSKLGIVFANTGAGATGAVAATVDNVKNIVGIATPNPANSPNCFAIAFTDGSAVASDAPTGTAALGAATVDAGVASYTVPNGVYDFKFTSDLKAVANTFSTLDTCGTYKATITLADTATP